MSTSGGYRRLGRVLLVAVTLATSSVVAATPASAASGGGCRTTGAVSACISFLRNPNRLEADFYLNQPPDFSRCRATLSIVKNGIPVKWKDYTLTYVGRYGPISVPTDTIPPSSGSGYNRTIVKDCNNNFHHDAFSPTIYYP